MESGRGGAREGAGRKPKGKVPTVKASYRLAAEVDAAVRARAEATGESQSQVVEDALRAQLLPEPPAD
jgi:hypothetical protein